MNRVQMLPSVIGRWRVEGKLQAISSSWLMLVECNLSVHGYCRRHCSCLFCCVTLRQRHGEKSRGLGLGLCRWTTSGVFWELREWIKYRVRGLKSCAEWRRRWMKGLMRVFSDGSAMLKEWGMIGLLNWYMWECVDSRLEDDRGMGGLIQWMSEKKGLNVGQGRRMVYGRNEWWGFVRGNAWSIARGMNPWLWRDATVTAIWNL